MSKLDLVKEKLFAHALYSLFRNEYVSQQTIGVTTNYADGGTAIVYTGCEDDAACADCAETCNFRTGCPECECFNLPHIRKEMMDHGYVTTTFCYKFVCNKTLEELVNIAKTLGVELEEETEEWKWYKEWDAM